MSGSGRSPGERHGNPLQCSCLENPMDREAWWATVYGVTKSRTGLKGCSPHPPLFNSQETSWPAPPENDYREEEGTTSPPEADQAQN